MTSSSCSMLAWPRQPVAICRGDVTDKEACWAPFWADFDWDPVEQNDLYFILETLSPFPSVLP